ncbi:serine/threonine-protein kinase [Allocoleopsis sp.]|uniref:serine/threonine-protein kinase n=1 Tax=Allocoleopsis sp. TaxID=3088169 RepID=UPI002FD49999
MPSDRKWQFWKPNPTRPQTLRTKHQTKTGTSTSAEFERWFKTTGLGHLLVGVWALAGAIATAHNGSLVQLIERQAQTLFFQIRGPVKAPNNIVILAIDDDSMTQWKKSYQVDPKSATDLEAIKNWPWKREAYAVAINRLMAAGAKTVSLDIVLDLPSSYGEADDSALQRVLQRYAGRVTLAASYEEDETRPGDSTKLIQPGSFLETNPTSVGSINYFIEPNGRIYRHAKEFPKLLAQQYSDPERAKAFAELVATVPSFDEATLQAAKLKYPQPKGNNIFFYGPHNTFEVIPFWNVLDSSNWNSYLQQGKYFKDKIVLIGPTATLLQDFHPTPFSESLLYPQLMSGVELHANAIATLLQGRSIAEAMPNPNQRALFVFIGVVGAGFLITRIKHLPIRIGLAAAAVLTWGGISYALFVYSRVILPTTVPVVALALSTLSYGTVGSIRDYFTKRNLRRTIKRYSSSPIIREIISQEDEFQGLLDERELELMETKLGGRYKIVKRLSAGGFGETYIAEDTQRPGNPQCVVKVLRPASNNPKMWELARRLFIQEAEILEKLGKHDQIPQLLAHFEEGEFYLVQEFVVGRPLTNELPILVPLAEAKVIEILRELLLVLEFIHSHGVIHRDIKPDNIIRRKSDGKLVLIDFGAVKELSTQLIEGEQRTELTVGIGTKGYMPNEQAAGNPKYNSDLYALGMIAIQALTVTHPAHLPSSPATGEVIWEDKATVSPKLAAIIRKMIRYNFRDRYQSATEALKALEPLSAALPPDLSNTSGVKDKPLTSSSSLQNRPDSTSLWSDASTPQDSQDSTSLWSDASTPQDSHDSTSLWSDASTPQDSQDSTSLWSDASTPQDSQDSTMPKKGTPEE